MYFSNKVVLRRFREDCGYRKLYEPKHEIYNTCPQTTIGVKRCGFKSDVTFRMLEHPSE